MQEPVLIICCNSARDNFCLALIQESIFFCSRGGNFLSFQSEELPCPWPSLSEAPTEGLLDLSIFLERPPSQRFLCLFLQPLLEPEALGPLTWL
jgi:hypothetical protein